MSDDDNNIIHFPHVGRTVVYSVDPVKRLGLTQYVLINRTPVKIDMIRWSQEFALRRLSIESGGVDPWRVAETIVGPARVSTVFIGINHAFFGGPPLVFETMIFGGTLCNYLNRCSTWEQAEAMHAEAVTIVRREHLKVIK